MPGGVSVRDVDVSVDVPQKKAKRGRGRMEVRITYEAMDKRKEGSTALNEAFDDLELILDLYK